MKIRVIHRFRDKSADLKLREAGETLTVNRERGMELIKKRLAEEVKEEKAAE